MSSTSSDDEIIGAEAEQEYGDLLDRMGNAPRVPEAPPKRVRLTNSQRLQLIDGFRQGKTDKFYNVIPNKNKPGDYRIVRRRKPLDVPIADNTPAPVKIEPEAPPQEVVVEEKSDKKDNFGRSPQAHNGAFGGLTRSALEPTVPGASGASGPFHTEFYTMQNTINNSLSKEIAAVMEKCNKIEAKMKKQKQKMREQRNQRQYQPEEYAEEYIEDEPDTAEPEYRHYTPRYSTRRRIDLRNF